MGKQNSSNKRTAREDDAKAAEAKVMAFCVKYARLIAGYRNGYKADPTGDSNFASLGDLQGARDTLEVLASLPVKTPHALSAKARIVPMMLEDADGLLEASSARFLASFAADVRAYMDPLCHEQWLADNAARQAQRMGRAA